MTGVVSWSEFERLKPELASNGKRLLWLDKPGKGGLAYLATTRRDGGPRVHPISPALLDGQLYAFVLKVSPKRRDLLRNGKYALHSFPHASLYTKESFNDEEFYLSGETILVTDDTTRGSVAKACGDPVDIGDVFRLGLERALHKKRKSGAVVYDKWGV